MWTCPKCGRELTLELIRDIAQWCYEKYAKE